MASHLFRAFALAVAIAAVLSVTALTRADVDLWGHLRFGLDILDSGTLESTDTYSFTSDRSWINHEWLSEVAIAGAWLAGGASGLILLKLACILGALGFMGAALEETRRHGARPHHVARADAGRPAHARHARPAAALLRPPVRGADLRLRALGARLDPHAAVDDSDSRPVGELPRWLAGRRRHGWSVVRWRCAPMGDRAMGDGRWAMGKARSAIGTLAIGPSAIAPIADVADRRSPIAHCPLPIAHCSSRLPRRARRSSTRTGWGCGLS